MTVFITKKLRIQKTHFKFRKIQISWDAGLGKWGMRFQPAKCSMMQITRKQIKKIYPGGNGP